MALLGQLRAEPLAQNGRYSRRRELKLHTQASAGMQTTRVVIHNLSSTGLLIETPTDLQPGEALDVNIPETGVVQAEVVWSSGEFYGCEFATPLNQAAVSAAVLVSPPQHSTIVFPEESPKSGRLSPLMKTAIIGGLAIASWGLVLGVAALLFA